MIVLLNSGEYFIEDCKTINEFLMAYVEYADSIDKKVFKILVDSNEMSTEELIEYINTNTCSYNDKIAEIYELGKQLYGY